MSLMESALRKALDEATALDRERLALRDTIRDAAEHLCAALEVGGLPGAAVARIAQAVVVLQRAQAQRGEAACARCGVPCPLILLAQAAASGERVCLRCEGETR